LIEGISEEQLRIPVKADKWSAFENIVHLAAYQPTFIKRVNLMLETNQPLFERYKAENDPVFHEYMNKSLSRLLSDIAEKRLTIVHVLEGLSEEKLNRTGNHQAYGLITIARWSDFFLLHEAHHLWTIFQLTSVLRAGATK
jgi:hypothetical protein